MASRKEKDILKGKLGLKTWVLLALLIIIGCVGYFFYARTQNNSTYTNIEYIKGYMTPSGTLNDWQGKLGCKGVEDMKWYLTEDELKIEFGRIALTWPPEEFVKQENLQLVGQIGITAKYNKKEQKLKLYWCNQEIERWVED